MSDIKWIKLSVDMFDDEKIKLIRTMPEGNAILIVWMQLLSLAGKTNDSGMIYIARHMAYSDEMLATIFNHPLNVIRLALKTLSSFDLIEVNPEGVINITNWNKHQNIEGMERVRKLTAERVRKHRERQDKLAIESPKENVTLPVTLRNATEEELELELDKELDRDKDTMSGKAEPPIPFKEIVSYLNEKAGTNYQHSGKKTRSLITARWNEGFKTDDFKKVVAIKTKEWLNDKDMSKFLRPETLFGTKFEGYLNQKEKSGGLRGYDTDEYDNFF